MIDPKALVEELRFGAEYGCDADLIERAADAIEELVADLGDADAMTEMWMKKYEALQAQLPKQGEIVRCRECKWYGIYEAKKDGTPDNRYSPSVCLRGIYAKRRDPDWYCADGEREVQE